MVIYVDVLILENFIINAFLLLLTMQITRQKINYIRLILVSLVLSLYTIVMIIPSLNIFATLPFKLIVSFLGVAIYLWKNKLSVYIKAWAIYIMISFLFAGICFYISINENEYNITSLFSINTLSLKYILLGGLALYIILVRVIIYVKDKIKVDTFLYNIKITINKNDYCIKGFLDTGDELVEPVSLKPVLIVEKDSLKDASFGQDVYYISFTNVNGNKGVMKGFIPDEIKIEIKGNYEERQAVICVVDNKLSVDGTYNALIARGLI